MLAIVVSIVLIVLLYLYGTRRFNYWKNIGVPFRKPIPFFGTHFLNFMQQKSVSQISSEIYEEFSGEKMVGGFYSMWPILILRDPELIKHVLIADFSHFYPRGLHPNKKVIEPMLKNLFFADGDLWKLLRQRLTPAFTTGKLKAMFPLIVERADNLQKIAAVAANSGHEIDVRDLMARYTTDFIGACGFGFDSDALKDEDSKFRKLGKRIFTFTARDGFVVLLKTLMPEIFKHWHFLVPEIEKDTVSLVKSIMEQRNYKPIGRNDFIDLLLELKEKGKIVGESVQYRHSDGTPKTVELVLDDLLMAAQVFVFFAAGFETSSSATSFTLHQLAFYPEIQKKVQAEIDEVLNRYDNKLSYDAIREMKYLEMTFKEGMRMFPPLGFLVRECAKKYTFPGTGVTIDEDIVVHIPLQAIQNDEKYFDNPSEFTPERFHPDHVNKIPKGVYLPFGEGPRACIGERLGLMQSLSGLAAVLHKFSVAPSLSTPRHPEIDPTSTITQSVKGGIPLQLFARKKDV